MKRLFMTIATLAGFAVSSQAAEISTFTGLQRGTSWDEFVQKMEKSTTAKATFSTSVLNGTTSGVVNAAAQVTDAPLPTTGVINLSNTAPIAWRSVGDSSDLLLRVTASDVLEATVPFLSSDATTPNFQTATGMTNTGYFQVNGKTSGALKITTANATAQTVTMTTAAQTVGAGTITIPDLAGTSVVPVYTTTAQTLSAKTLATVTGSTQALSGAGAVNVTTLATKLTSTGGAQALTLADGADGQIKVIIHDVDGGSSVLTPTTKTGFSTITFTAVGESATLMFVTTRGWIILALNGAVAG